MNRRGFLGALMATMVVDPEKLLWVPGKKLISIPEPKPLLEFGTAQVVILKARALGMTTLTQSLFVYDYRHNPTIFLTPGVV